MIVCPSCGHENQPGAKFCSECGITLVETAAAPREERKVVTVLFADLVGFTSRAEQLDPEDVRALLSPYYARLRAELERFGGTVEKFIGDAVMALFGAPVAHEDDPERAVRAALAIRDWVQEQEEELQVRIAVNTGEALIALGARPEAGEGMASGDVVNTTARLQSAAPVNGILVGEMTYRTTSQVIDYREAEPVAAKGKAEPVSVWEALQARSRLGVDVVQPNRAPLIGRERERELVVSALERVREERAPQLVTLVGVPGIGKTRLVSELMQSVEAQPDLVTWRQGRSLPYGEGVTLWALAEMIKAQAGVLETDSAERAEEKLRRVVREVVTDLDDAEWVERHLLPLVGLGSDGILGGDRRGEAFAAWRRFFEALAEHRPLVLVFEDLHWADDGLLDFVDHLVDWGSGVPLLVLCTARPELLERRPGWGGGKPNAFTLSLSPLSDEQTARLIAALLDRSLLPAETQAALLARAGGNPLYAEQYVRMLAERGDDEELPLPETVQGIIAARLDALSREEKSLLQDAAVLGKVFWSGAVASLGGVERRTAEDCLHALERKEFVQRARRSSVAGETEYAFPHLLVRDVAYGQIPRAQRAEKHRLSAEWIESLGRSEDHAEMLAHHYLSALELAKAAGVEDAALVERARAAAREAGDRALALNAFPAAARFYSHALALVGDDSDQRPELIFRLGRALHLAGDERAEQLLRDASAELVRSDRSEDAAEAHALLSEIWWDRGKRDRAFREIERARELLGQDESAARAHVLARLARMQTIAGEREEAILAGREALAIAKRLDLDDVRAHALNSIGTARYELGDVGGMADLEHGIEIALAARSHLASSAYNNLGYMHFIAGDVRRDAELREESRRLAERMGDARMLRFLRGVRPIHDFYGGRWDDALREADAFIGECESGSPHYLESSARWIRALIRLARDERDAAAADAQRAEALAREARDAQQLLPALAVRLRVETELGRSDAHLLADELLGQSNAVGGRPPSVELAWTAERLQKANAVREWLGSIVLPSAWNAAALAIVDEQFVRAADLFAAIGSAPDEAYARLRAAEALVEQGRRAEADEQLQRALAFYRSVGATHYIREGEALLAASA